jgi:hypothetical protein
MPRVAEAFGPFRELGRPDRPARLPQPSGPGQSTAIPLTTAPPLAIPAGPGGPGVGRACRHGEVRRLDPAARPERQRTAARRRRRTIRRSRSRYPGAAMPARRRTGRERIPRAGPAGRRARARPLRPRCRIIMQLTLLKCSHAPGGLRRKREGEPRGAPRPVRPAKDRSRTGRIRAVGQVPGLRVSATAPADAGLAASLPARRDAEETLRAARHRDHRRVRRPHSCRQDAARRHVDRDRGPY